jgi:hypothetical protein
MPKDLAREFRPRRRLGLDIVISQAHGTGTSATAIDRPGTGWNGPMPTGRGSRSAFRQSFARAGDLR